MVLLLDIGNTRIKWAQLLDDGTLTPQQAFIHRGVETQVWMRQLFRERFRPRRLLISNVAGAGMEALIASETQRLWQIEPQFARSAAIGGGVTHGYPEVAQHGIDRWLATIAAFHQTNKGLPKISVCVIDAGTAVTVDGVDDKGLHLGGFILPGKQTMIDALLGQTSDIAHQVRKFSAQMSPATAGRGGILATGTAQAVANGAVVAIAAAADRGVAAVAQQAKVAPAVFITGGDAGLIRKFMQSQQVQEVPDLVLQGLALMHKEMK